MHSKEQIFTRSLKETFKQQLKTKVNGKVQYLYSIK